MASIMLSPHEFSALLLVARASDLRELDPDDLASLVERQLIALEQLAPGSRCPRLTADGDSVLRTIAKRH